jgi:alkylhydroperoxidase family enzyme
MTTSHSSSSSRATRPPQTNHSRRPERDRPEWKGQRPEELLRYLAIHPVVGDALLTFGDTLLDDMNPRTRELVALRVSAVLENAYIWHGHCHVARNNVLSLREIAGVAIGPSALVGRDAAVLRAVDELLSDARLGRVAYFALRPEALQVMLATGFYRIVATIMHGVDPEPGVAPILGLETPAQARKTYAAFGAS